MIHFDQEKLIALMEEFDLNKSNLARLTGYTPSYVLYLLDGRRPITPNVNKRLNIAFDQLTDIEQIKRKREKIIKL